MKILLNDQKIKQTDCFIFCDECIFVRESDDKRSIQCLARLFNLHKNGQICALGYQYEDKV